ncbi:MAG: hypothetical protein RLZZ519_2127 [Bacteroidota bacterium]|jgi:TonB-dependent receptor
MCTLYGTRTRNKKFGMVAGVSWYGRNWASDHYQTYYGSNLDHNMTRLELRDYNGQRNTVGTNLMLEYKPNEKLRVYGRGMYGLMQDNERQFKTMYNWSTGVGQSIKLQNIHNKMNFQLAGGDLGADIRLGEKTSMNLRVATYDNQFGYGNVPFQDKSDARNGYYVLEFEKNVIFTDFLYLDEFGNVTDEFNAFNKLKVLDIDSPIEGYGDHYDSIQPRYRNIIPYKPTDTMFAFTRAYTETNASYERDPIVAQADWIVNPSSAWRLKFGGKYRIKEGGRTIGLELWDRSPAHPNPLLYNTYHPQAVDENGGFLQEIGSPYDGRLFPQLPDGQVDAFIQDRGDTLRYLPLGVKTPYYSQFIGSSYRYTESVVAAYAMAGFEPSVRWILTGGLRAEYTNPTVTGDSVIEDLQNNTRYVVPISAGKNYLAVLPMLNAKYVLGANDQIRMAATRSFRRPNFNEIKPGQPAINYTNFDLIYGNPLLRPSYSWNLDLSYEHFFGLDGMVSLAGFYKHVTDHIYTAFESSSADNTGISNQFQIPGGVISKKYQNAPKAFAAGVEFSFSKKLSFLPWKFKDFGIATNYAHTWSAMEISTRNTPQPLPRQSPDVLNAALFFEDSTFTIRLALNYKAPYLTELNLYAVQDPQSGDTIVVHQDNDFDMFMGQSMSLDFSIAVRISNHLSLFGEALNLTNNPMVIYRGRRERPVKTEYYSVRGLVGIKLNF